MTPANMRRAFKALWERAGFGIDWTSYDLRHSFVSLVLSQLDDLVEFADLVGTSTLVRHWDTATKSADHSARRRSMEFDAWP